jgi:hypothetical protein
MRAKPIAVMVSGSLSRAFRGVMLKNLVITVVSATMSMRSGMTAPTSRALDSRSRWRVSPFSVSERIFSWHLSMMSFARFRPIGPAV